MTFWWRVSVRALLLLAALLPAPIWGQTKIRIAYSALNANNAPFWIAQEKGMFKKNGLDVELIYVAGGSSLVSAMMAGDAPVAHVGAPLSSPQNSEAPMSFSLLPRSTKSFSNCLPGRVSIGPKI